MATRSGFIRPSDPINAVDMAANISTAIGKTVTCEVTLTDILVTGTGLSSADDSAIQVAITAYSFAYLQYGAVISDNPDMSGNRHDRGVTEHAAYMADTNVASVSNKVQSSGSTIITGAWPILRKATTNSSGVAVIYLTTDGTSGTGAAFSTVYEDGIVVMGVGAANYNPTTIVISGDKKTCTVTLNQIKSVLGLLSYNATADAGVEVRAAVWGK